MMRIAIPTWQDSVSPVFDVAQTLLVADTEAGIEQARRYESLADPGMVVIRTEHLKALAVNVVICSALSWPFEQALASAGIQVISHVCGNVEDVLGAYLANRLQDRAFAMPGCGACRRKRRRGRWS